MPAATPSWPASPSSPSSTTRSTGQSDHTPAVGVAGLRVTDAEAGPERRGGGLGGHGLSGRGMESSRVHEVVVTRPHRLHPRNPTTITHRNQHFETVGNQPRTSSRLTSKAA